MAFYLIYSSQNLSPMLVQTIKLLKDVKLCKSHVEYHICMLMTKTWQKIDLLVTQTINNPFLGGNENRVHSVLRNISKYIKAIEIIIFKNVGKNTPKSLYIKLFTRLIVLEK